MKHKKPKGKIGNLLKKTKRKSRKAALIGSDSDKTVIPCMKNIPFIPASTKFSCKSYSIFANVQQVFSMMKHHNIRRCVACKHNTFQKNMELKRILNPEFFNRVNPTKNNQNKTSNSNNNNNNISNNLNDGFQSLCTGSDALLKLLQLYNKEYEQNIITYRDLLRDISRYVKNNDKEKIKETEDKILKLYQFLKKKSDEMLMIKYLIESIPSGPYGEGKGQSTHKKPRWVNVNDTDGNTNGSHGTILRVIGKKVRIATTKSGSCQPIWKKVNNNGSKEDKDSKPTMNWDSSTDKEKDSELEMDMDTMTSLFNSNLNSSYPKSTLELLRFSQRIQEFLSKEHYLRST